MASQDVMAAAFKKLDDPLLVLPDEEQDGEHVFRNSHTDWGRRSSHRDSDVGESPFQFRGLYVKPKIRISDGERASTFSELFFDMIFIFVLQNMFTMPWTVSGQATFAFYYVLLWNSWVGTAFFNTRFDTDDLLARLFALANMLAVVGMAVAAGRPVVTSNGRPGGFTTFILSYCFIRSMLVLQYCRVWLALPLGRALSSRFIAGFTAGVACWVVVAVRSTYSEGGCECLSTALPAGADWLLVAAGLAFDYGTPFALLPWMVAVHNTHMPERFACFIVLMFTGQLFNFVQTMGQPTDGAEAGYFLCVTLGIMVSFLFIQLYAQMAGPDMDGFADSIARKLKVYAFLYLHMPLALVITLVSTTLGHIQCLGSGRADAPANASLDNMLSSSADVSAAGTDRTDGTLLVLSISCGSILILLGILHTLSADGNLRRGTVRACCGVVVAVSYATVPSMECHELLLLIACVLGVQVILDYSVYMNQLDLISRTRIDTLDNVHVGS